MDYGKILIGSALVVAGITPTPDDVTIVSPAIQIIGGSALIIAGLVTNEKK